MPEVLYFGQRKLLSFLIRTITVGGRIALPQRKPFRRLYCRWGLSPRPKEYANYKPCFPYCQASNNPFFHLHKIFIRFSARIYITQRIDKGCLIKECKGIKPTGIAILTNKMKKEFGTIPNSITHITFIFSNFWGISKVRCFLFFLRNGKCKFFQKAFGKFICIRGPYALCACF